MILKVEKLIQQLNFHLLRASALVELLDMHGIGVDNHGLQHLGVVTLAELHAAREQSDEDQTTVEMFLRTLPGYEPDDLPEARRIIPAETFTEISELRSVSGPSAFEKVLPKAGPVLTTHDDKEAIKGPGGKPVKVTMSAELSEKLKTKKKRNLSPDARKRIAAAQRKRWAKFRREG